MTPTDLWPHDTRAHGRYIKAPPCDACGKPTNEAERYTDDEICQGSDGPGFYLCHRKRCIALRDIPLDERRKLYTQTRAASDAINARSAAARVNQFCGIEDCPGGPHHVHDPDDWTHNARKGGG